MFLSIFKICFIVMVIHLKRNVQEAYELISEWKSGLEMKFSDHHYRGESLELRTVGYINTEEARVRFRLRRQEKNQDSMVSLK